MTSSTRLKSKVSRNWKVFSVALFIFSIGILVFVTKVILQPIECLQPAEIGGETYCLGGFRDHGEIEYIFLSGLLIAISIFLVKVRELFSSEPILSTPKDADIFGGSS